MGKKDAITKEYIKRPDVFADAFNQHVFKGRQVLRSECLQELDTTKIALPYGADGVTVPKQRIRDALKLFAAMTDGRMVYCILGIEAQSHIHYAIPVKNGVYDFMELEKQVSELERAHRAGAGKVSDAAGDGKSGVMGYKPTSGEYLSGFWKTDRLIPVVTLVIYFGADEWDGPLTLKEMYACEDEEILAYAADYRVNLIAPASLTDEEMELFRSDLREVMKYIKYSKDKEALKSLMEENERYSHLDREAAEVINVITNSKLKFEEEEEEVNMCLAIDQMREESEQKGMQMSLITQVCRKIVKGKTPDTIAEELEEEIAAIDRIYNVAVKYAPDYDADQIYAELGA